MITQLGNILIATLLVTSLPKIEAPETANPSWIKKVFGISVDDESAEIELEEIMNHVNNNYFNKTLIKRILLQIKAENTGVFTAYYPNGNKSITVSYKENMLHGHFHGWYANGSEAFKGYFQLGKRQGAHITFHPSNFQDSAKDKFLLNFNEEGKLEGKQYISHPNNVLGVFAFFKNGLLQGHLTACDETNSQYLCKFYKDGKILPSQPKNYQRPDVPCPYEHYADEITAEFIKEAKEKYGVEPFCVGGSMPWDVVSLHVDFNIQKHADTNQARAIVLDLMQILKNKIDNHEKIRPYLREYPFPLSKASVGVSFLKDKLDFYKDGSVAHMGVTIKKQMLITRFYPNEPNKQVREYEPFIEPQC